MPCLTANFDPRIGPIINLGIEQPKLHPNTSSASNKKIQLLAALIDTGASKTCICDSVAQTLNLPVIGKAPMTSASSTVIVNEYLCDLHIPFGIPGQCIEINYENIPLMGFNAAGNSFKILLGRDVLQLGTLHYSGLSNQFTLCM